MNLQENIQRIRQMMGISNLNTTVGYHISYEPIHNIDDRFLKNQTPRDKPEGLWFAYDPKTWYDFFFKSVDPKELYMYELKMDNSNFLILDSIEKINEFNDEFESDKPLVFETYGIIWKSPNWLKVKEIYDGVEFPNYKELKKDINFTKEKNYWLAFIDVNSGCLWNSKAIKSFKQI